jgi:hypothetical protein
MQLEKPDSELTPPISSITALSQFVSYINPEIRHMLDTSPKTAKDCPQRNARHFRFQHVIPIRFAGNGGL